MSTIPDASPKRINYFLIERLSLFLLVLAFILRCMGWVVYYANLSPVFRFHCLKHLIRWGGLRALDLGKMEILEADKVFTDGLNFIPTAVNDFMEQSKVFSLVEDACFGVKEGGKSLKTALYAQATRRYHIVYYFLLLLRSAPIKPRFVLTYIYRDIYVSNYLRHIEAPVLNIAPSFWSIKLWECGARTLKGAPSKICRRFFRQPSINKLEDVARRVPDTYKTLYFPHQSIFYGQLFAKDHFYSERQDSLLHSSNILHVEFRPSSCPNEHLEKQKEMNLETYTLNGLGVKVIFFSMTEFFHFLWQHRKQLLNASAKRSLCMQLLILYIEFRHYVKEVLPIEKNAQLAIVGYDMLLPAGLALALKSLGIQTVATQERLYPVFQAPYCSVILDHYLVASNFVKDRLAAAPNFCVNNVISVGMVRTDLLHRYSSLHRDMTCFKKSSSVIVTVLDFHSEKNADAQRLCPVNNWTANKNFYFDVIQLAKFFNELHITIRGKDDAWLHLEYFQDVKQVIQSLPNVEVSREYGMLNESYRLCANSDLVIAKHTSLADECLAVGKQVLIHDYTHNSRSLLSASFDYFGAPFFCHSFEELRCGVQRYLDTGCVMDPKQYEAIRSRVFEGRADGKVRQRVQQVILDILQGDSAPGSADA
ncbi:MAG: hypothetical protein PWQ57_257 [Desulfovibrionales bacterium]|nr:hypothetical protein [Desulfovibrionales bacterium]